MKSVGLVWLCLVIFIQQTAGQCSASVSQSDCLANIAGCFWCGNCYTAAVSDAAQFPAGCTAIQGSITITGSTFTSLSVLQNVQTITQCLVIQGTTALVTAGGMTSIYNAACLVIKDNTNLESVSRLGTVTSFTQQVVLQNNPKLANLEVFRYVTAFSTVTIDNTGIYDLRDFPQLSASEVTIQNCARLANLTGVTNVPTYSKLTIKNNAVLKKPDALINQISGVAVLLIEGNPSLESMSVTLQYGGDLQTVTVKDNPNLLIIDGRKHNGLISLVIEGNRRLNSLGVFLNDLNSLGSGVVIRNNMALPSCALPKISGLSPEIIIDGNANLRTIAFNELMQVSGANGKLQITNNLQLTEIIFPKLDALGTVQIWGNPNLVTLSLPAFRSLYGGELYITDNENLATITLPALDSGLTMYIQDNPRLATITANILRQPDVVKILRNPSLTTISMPALGQPISIYIEDNDWLASINLPVQQLTQLLSIKNNYNLHSISLPNFVSAQTGISFENNPSLVTVSLPALHHVTFGYLTVKNNYNLSHFDVPVAVLAGLYIQDNPQLVTIGDFANVHTAMVGPLVVLNNPRLAMNTAQLTAWTGLPASSGVTTLTMSGASLCCAGITAMANRIGFNGYVSPLCDDSAACGGSSAPPTIPPVPTAPAAPAPAPNTPVRCGSGYGSCASGCCGSDGYCGAASSAVSCGPGCQGGYGMCYGCGPITGTSCASGCCSNFGYCGVTPDYCDALCQTGWGQCTGVAPVPVSSTVVPSTSISSTAVSSTAPVPSSTYESSTFPSTAVSSSVSSSVVSSTYQSSTAPSSTVESSTFPSSPSSSTAAAVSSTVVSSSASVSSALSSSVSPSSTHESAALSSTGGGNSSPAPEESSSTADSEPIEEVVICGSGAYPVGELCEPCAVNTYSPEGLACLPCPANAHTDFGGTPSRAECICNAGYDRSDMNDESFTCVRTIELPPADEPPPLGQKSVRFMIVICSLSHLPLINTTIVNLGVHPARLNYQSFLSNGTLAAYVDIGPPLAAFPNEKSASKVYELFAMMIARKELPSLCASSAINLVADTDAIQAPPAPPSSSSSVYSSPLFIGLVSGIIAALCVGLAVGIWIRQSHKRKREVYASPTKARRKVVRTNSVIIREKTKATSKESSKESSKSDDALLPGQAPIHVHVHVTPELPAEEAET